MMLRSVDPETLDENYDILSRTTWAPDETTTITWERQGENAIGTFPTVRHAYEFLNYHLNQQNQPGRPSAFRQKDDSKSIPQSDESFATSLMGTFDDAHNGNNHINALQMLKIEGAVSVPINLNDLDTAVLRGIIDAEPDNHNRNMQNNEKYKMLTQVQWRGQCTKKIEWRREGQNVVAKFGSSEDATQFVFGYLGRSIYQENGFLSVETEDSMKHRGRVAESQLWKGTKADDIQMPERQPWGVPVEVTIPLAFLNANGLKERLTLYTEKTRIIVDVAQPLLPDKNSGPA